MKDLKEDYKTETKHFLCNSEHHLYVCVTFMNENNDKKYVDNLLFTIANKK